MRRVLQAQDRGALAMTGVMSAASTIPPRRGSSFFNQQCRHQSSSSSGGISTGSGTTSSSSSSSWRRANHHTVEDTVFEQQKSSSSSAAAAGAGGGLAAFSSDKSAASAAILPSVKGSSSGGGGGAANPQQLDDDFRPTRTRATTTTTSTTRSASGAAVSAADRWESMMVDEVRKEQQQQQQQSVTAGATTATKMTTADKKSSSKSNSKASASSSDESGGIQPLDYYPRRVLFNLTVRSARFTIPVALTAALTSVVAGASAGVSAAVGGGAAAAAVGSAVVTGALSPWSVLSLMQVVPIVASVGIAQWALLKRMMLPGTGARRLAHAQRSADTIRSAALTSATTTAASTQPISSERLPLTGQVAVVLGASGAVGSRVAAQLQALGARVIITHIPPPAPASSTAASSAPTHSSSGLVMVQPDPPPLCLPFESYPLDLADRLSVRTFCAALLHGGAVVSAPSPSSQQQQQQRTAPLPRIDMLVHCAGVYEGVFAPTRHGTDRHTEINFLGPFLVTESLLPLLQLSQRAGLAADAVDAEGCVATATSSASGSGGGRVIFTSCSLHSLVGQQVPLRDVVNAYDSTNNASTNNNAARMQAQLREDPEDGYKCAVLYAASKAAVIHHTLSLYERRYDGTISATGEQRKVWVSNSAVPSPSSASPATAASPFPQPSAVPVVLQPIVPACVVLPPLLGYFNTSRHWKLPADVVAAYEKQHEEGGKKTKEAAVISSGSVGGGGHLQPLPRAAGLNSAVAEQLRAAGSANTNQNNNPVLNGGIVHFARPTWLRSQWLSLWQVPPQSAAEAVLDACLRPDLRPGGMYANGREMSRYRRAAAPTSTTTSSSWLSSWLPPAGKLLECLSAAALDGGQRRRLVAWAAQQTKAFAVPYSHQHQPPAALPSTKPMSNTATTANTPSK